MKKSAQYKILPELKIMIEYFSVETTLNDMIEHRKILIKDKDYNPGFNFITDFRDTILACSYDDILSYIEFAKKEPNMLGKRRAAILTETPNQTAISVLYVLNLHDLPFIVEIFSTMDAAIKWVGLSQNDKSIVEEIIKNMKAEINYL
jgi:hypothetical protein